MLSLGRFVAGSAACVAVVGALAYGSLVLRRSLLPSWRGLLARLAEAVVGLSVFFAVAQVLGAVHLFSRWAVLLGALAAGGGLTAAGRLVRTATHEEAPGALVPRGRPRGEVVVTIVGVGIVVAQWSTHVVYALGRGMTHADTLWYHEPYAAAFVQQHSFTGLDSLGHDVVRWFPFNGHVVHAVGILAFDSDVLSPFVNLGWMALALLACWCIGERRGVGHLSLLGGAVTLGLPAMVATQPGQASIDIACAALLLASIALLVWSRLEPVPVALAGLAAGMALGTKATIAASIAVLAIGVLVIALVQRRRAAAVCWTVALAASGSFWFLRDWVIAGTPLPWFEINIGPVHLARVIPKGEPPLASDVLDLHAWRVLYLDGMWQGFGRLWPVVLLVLVAAVFALCMRERDAVHRLVALVLVAGVIGYVFTPLTGGFGFVFSLRYLGPVLLIAFAVLPASLSRGGRWRRAWSIVLMVLVAVNATMPNRERIPAWPARPLLVAVLVVAAVAGIVVLAARVRAVPAYALAFGVMVLGFWFAQRHYLDHRYVRAGLRNDEVNEYFRDIRSADVVVFGSDEVLPMFGLDLSNHVRRGDVPRVDLGTDPCRAWKNSLQGADFVVLIEPEFGYFERPAEADVASDPAAHLERRADTGSVYRISGALDPSRCPSGV